MKDSKKVIPCIDCLCFPSCRQYIENHFRTPVNDLCVKCSILNDYMMLLSNNDVLEKDITKLHNIYDISNIRKENNCDY